MNVRLISLTSYRFLHSYSPIDNIELKAAPPVSEVAVGDVAILTLDGKANIVTLDANGKISVFSPDSNDVIESFTPDGHPTCVRVFPQFQDTLFIGYTKQGAGGALVGTLLVVLGANKMEVEAHDNNITDII